MYIFDNFKTLIFLILLLSDVLCKLPESDPNFTSLRGTEPRIRFFGQNPDPKPCFEGAASRGRKIQKTSKMLRLKQVGEAQRGRLQIGRETSNVGEPSKLIQ